MSGWTLWQALPPRYQLTCKDFTQDNNCYVNLNLSNSPRAPRSPRPITPRQGSATGCTRTFEAKQTRHRSLSKHNAQRHRAENVDVISTPRDQHGDLNDSSRQKLDVSAASPRTKATMYFTVTSPRGKSAEGDKRVIAQSSFPSRKSSFVNTFKQQQMLNSMRQTLDDPSTSSPRNKKRSSFNTSNFPVTRIKSDDIKNFESRQLLEKQRAKTATRRNDPKYKQSDNESARRKDSKSAGSERTPNQNPNFMVDAFIPLDDSVKPFLKNPIYTEKPSRRYVVRKLDDATMFIDDDKVIFIKKKTTKNDILQCQKEEADDTNYLSHLRKLYLKEPKDMAKFVQYPKKTLIRERLEYDKKTDNILNYYSRIDDRENAFAWAMSIEQAKRSKEIQLSARSPRAQSSPGRRREFSSRPQMSLTERPATSIPFRKDAGSDLTTNIDALSDWNAFVKFNSQSILHDRQFYLQTPMVNSDSKIEVKKMEDNQENCECRLCRLEMELMKQGQNGLEPFCQSVRLVNSEVDSKSTNPKMKKKIDKSNSKNVSGRKNPSNEKKKMEEIPPKIEDLKLNEPETIPSPVSPALVTKVDKQTSTENDLVEKTTINLTIDLSNHTINATALNSEDNIIETDRQTSESIPANKEIDSSLSYNITETNEIDIVSFDQRGDEETRKTKNND